MRFIRFLAPALTALLFGAPILRAQDFSKYRDFSLGTNLATVLKRTEKKLADVTTTHGAPALFQEVTRWPPSLPGASTLHVGYDMQQKSAASWQDSQYCLNLVRTASSNRFGLLIYSKRVNTEAELGLLEAAKFEREQAPAREAERQKKETDALELTRQQNQKSFRP